MLTTGDIINIDPIKYTILYL